MKLKCQSRAVEFRQLSGRLLCNRPQQLTASESVNNTLMIYILFNVCFIYFLIFCVDERLVGACLLLLLCSRIAKNKSEG